MEQREEIISRSEKLFMRYGVRSVTMDDVSRELGVSKKTLYQHFDNKDALVEAVVGRHVERKRCVIESIGAQAKDALDEIRNIGAFITATIEDVSPSALFDLQKYFHKSWETLMQGQDDHMIRCLTSNLERGMREGLYRSDLQPEIVAKIYAKATCMMVEELARHAQKFTRRQLVWELHNYHVHAIASPKGLKKWAQYSQEMNYYETGDNFPKV